MPTRSIPWPRILAEGFAIVTRRLGVVVIAALGCGTPTEPGPYVVPDGDYSISLSDPIVHTDSASVPEWVFSEPTIYFTVSDVADPYQPIVHVTGSTDGIARLGETPPGIASTVRDHWLVNFPLSSSASGNALIRWWAVKFTATDCIGASAFAPEIDSAIYMDGIHMSCIIARQ